ncbi:MAG: hypothetical protein QOI63_616 [Thermoplasmata archaeon]|jgi:hypothetical protein|nr:hypothetical protein [Thermoplasmata archaeon]
MRHGIVLALLLSSLLSFVPSATAQAETLYDFALTVEPGTHIATLQDGAVAHITFTDHSRDAPGGFVPGTSGGVLTHFVTFSVTPGFEEHDGWQASSLGTIASYPGESYTRDFKVQVFPQATNPYFVAHINATITTTDGSRFYRTGDILFFTRGIPGFTVLPGPSIDSLQPVEIKQASLQVYNVASVKRSFDFTVSDNTCGLDVAPPATVVVLPHQFQKVEFSVRGPNSRFSPLSDDNCVVGIGIAAQDNPGQVLLTTIPVKVTGTYFDPLAVFYVLLAIALVVLLVLFLRRRKERLEEEILGKPQKPWTIPVEQVYLRHLKAKDQRAWYVVRHYLMEDEYRSSLLWYRAYKKATKGDRRKERLVLVQEKAYGRWKATWEKAIAKPVRKADRLQAKLEKKLARKDRKAHRKATAKWRAAVRKLEAKHAKRVEREAALHGKLLARARKKGLPDPELPEVPAPELPPEPTLQARPLAGHRWARKEARFRKRMLRRQGNLEVQFEKADARKRLQLRRKVQKLAHDLGDAEFVAEHVASQ